MWLVVLLCCIQGASADVGLGLSFNSSFGSFMVLQQQPASACLYGMLGDGGTAATITIASTTDLVQQHSVAAAVDADGGWKACLPPNKVGGDYTVTATCKGCTNTTAAVLDHVTFGDVWYCSGQSNMALPVIHSYSRNVSRDAILAGKYANIRIHGLDGNMNPFQPWASLKQAVMAPPAALGVDPDPSSPYHLANTASKAGSSMFVQFSATCYYFGQSLTDEFIKAGAPPTPIGLIHTAWGGSTIEQWLSNETIATCAGSKLDVTNQKYHDSRVLPYTNMALKGFAWYQGENDCSNVMGNSEAKTGYSCLMQSLVQQWRDLWSCPTCSFGIVTLASSGSEGASSHAMGAMRQAQTAGYGVLPARDGIMANTFMAHAYDLDDQWSGDRGPCVETGWNKTTPAVNCCGKGGRNTTTCTDEWAAKCSNMCYANVRTAQYMGGIHPRSKGPVGERLASAAFNTVYDGKAAYTGPTIAGCGLAASMLTIAFDVAMLRGDTIVVQNFSEPSFTPYYHGHGNPMFNGGSQLYVQTKAASFCIEPQHTDPTNASSPVYCPTWAGGVGKSVTRPAPIGRFPTFGGAGATTGNDPNQFNQGWINLPLTAGKTPATITVDLAPLKGAVPTAVRYGWGILNCCDLTNPTTFTSKDCLANCPVMGSTGLPANPFIARIVGGKCACVAPQVCDA